MYYTPWGGEQVVIPEEHEKVLALYRDSMPLVWEVQEYGPPMLYALIDEDEEPLGTPPPSKLEDLARRTANTMRRDRLQQETFTPPNLEALMYAAIRARLADYYQSVGAVNFEDGVDVTGLRAETAQATEKEARTIGRAVTRIVREVIAEQAPIILGPCDDPALGR